MGNGTFPSEGGSDGKVVLEVMWIGSEAIGASGVVTVCVSLIEVGVIPSRGSEGSN
jgi:hypothetical protein